MKKIDYYAVQHPWRMPKWLGATLGGIFGFILIVSGVAIVKLTRPPVAALAALPSTSATTPVAAAPASPAAKPTTVAAVAAPAPVAQADTAPAPAAKHHGKHHAAASRHAGGKAFASAKHAKPVVLANASSKHDSRSKLKEKDALDKLLGL